MNVSELGAVNIHADKTQLSRLSTRLRQAAR